MSELHSVTVGITALGDYIGGAFHAPTGDRLTSHNPARDGEVVLDTAVDAERMALAARAACDAQASWRELSIEARYEHLQRFLGVIQDAKASLADAIVLEMGKLRSEALIEITTLEKRIPLVWSQVLAGFRDDPAAAARTRFHPLGVVGILGPFNFPLHLCHAHAIPALLLGNSVVIKPSEICPLAGQRYAEAVHAAGFPPGVVNVVQGTGAGGAALVAHPDVRGICFTGSYGVGRKLQEAVLDRPEVLLALEMGGKNTVVVLSDADIRQAAHEVVVGGYLTTGQRCTGTDRVLVERSVAGALTEAVSAMVRELRFGDPDDTRAFAGPLANHVAADKFRDALTRVRAAGASCIAEGWAPDGGCYVSPTLHVLPDGTHFVEGYTDIEVFGPDVGIEVVEDVEEAISVINDSPYGFANSIFTQDDARFEKIYRDTHVGILNRNRSTNLASAALPFGGVGRSGNYRPAGAYAARNVVVPVAVQENVGGTVQAHRLLAGSLPPPDLDVLADKHEREEQQEMQRSLLETPRPMAVRRPKAGSMPTSSAWLRRLYAGDRVVREKKPAVFDHLRSAGPWFVSVDDEPLSVLDGMSQTSTLCGGFGQDQIAQCYYEGGFGPWIAQNTDTSGYPAQPADEFADVLRHLVPGLSYVAYANSGAEANEKALALCKFHASSSERKRVLAFEGGFHGRTLLALHATYNPAKRTPFELAGYEATFAPFPVWRAPGTEPPAPSGFYASVAAADIDGLKSRFGNADDDPLLAAEVESLAAIDAALKTDEFFACIVEPMQSEGGDRYGTARFFRALRLLTRQYDVPLIMDEVQTGFGLGGAFAWHEVFNFVNARGQRDAPDVVTFAKRAQLGVVMSVYEDPEPTSAHVASMIRGRLHAELMSTGYDAERIQKLVASNLASIAATYPHLVGDPRGRGYAFAFDLPSKDQLTAFIGQRFWRGAIVYGAGSRTVRYRLSEAFHAREVQLLFETIRRSLSWLDAHPGKAPLRWEDFPEDPVAQESTEVSYHVRRARPEEAESLLPVVLDIEYQVYEPARRTEPILLKRAMEDVDGIVTVAEIASESGREVIGFGIAAPLEASVDVEEGPADDSLVGTGTSLYSMSITVAKAYQGQGVGRAIKREQLREASLRRKPDGTPRYRFVSSRNRVGRTAAMRHLNRVYGAHIVSVLTGQYADPEGQAIYSRIPLPPYRPQTQVQPAPSPAVEIFSDGISQPFRRPPSSLSASIEGGLLYGPTVNKITLLNFATSASVRAMEWCSALVPSLPHMYLTSSRDELVDKCLRVLRWHRSDAQVAIGLDGGYVGHTTAAARSISDPAVHRAGPGLFAWPRALHPQAAGAERALKALRELINKHGADKVLGVFYEPMQERTGHVLDAGYLEGLARLRDDTGVPLVAVETASAFYRTGDRPFFETTLVPDLMCWWGGAQTGYIHTSASYWVDKPLTMVSTWDGDELSLVREHHGLRAARTIDVADACQKLDELARELADKGLPMHGRGLYRVVHAGTQAESFASKLRERAAALRAVPPGCLLISLPRDDADGAVTRLCEHLRSIL